MKQCIAVIILFILPFAAQSENRFYGDHKQRVIDQHNQDLANRDRVLNEVRGFMKEMNQRVSRTSSLKLSTPLDEKSIEGVQEITGLHEGGVILPRIYGYVNTESLNIRTDGSSAGKVIGRLKFREKVEILYQSEKIDDISGHKSPWLLVKLDNGNEGWAFGYFISENRPIEKDRPADKTDWRMKMPAKGFISSNYGYRIDPITKKRKSFHKGIDIAAPKGTPVYAAAEGTVNLAKYVTYGYGNLIILKHKDSLATYYGHLSSILVRPGASIKKGQLIGKVGSTGRSTGPHLHFEVRKGEKTLNPADFVR